MIRCAILVVSDSCHSGARSDTAGPRLKSAIEDCGWRASIAIVPDEKEQIEAALRRFCDEDQADAVFTTGGTGIALRDVTPEATRAVLERELPGIAEWIRLKGREETPMSLLSRAVAGTRGRTLIVNLPGSPRGALHSLQLIVDLAPHIVDLLHGKTSHEPGAKLEAGR